MRKASQRSLTSTASPHTELKLCVEMGSLSKYILAFASLPKSSFCLPFGFEIGTEEVKR